MNSIERDAALSAHAEAKRLTREAYTALAAANADHAAAVAKRADLVQQAAAGSGLPAADLVRAGGRVTEAAAGVELAAAIYSAARHREFELSGPADEAARENQTDRRNAAIARRIEAAERLDRAVAEAEAAIAEMTVAGIEARAEGMPGYKTYHVQITERKVEAFGFEFKDLRNIADLEARLTGHTLARAPIGGC
ncbi:hypothetical protein [Acidiphilium sp.]|uniref:hypothetical protein n=1 Tax=Acidiphilium sp. TaxID=527 RepID=UPI00258DFCB7|nr:hypothetical protein [Acidiphilium sp.]